MLSRSLTVLVWALFSVSSTLLGMLPVRGWLWRPDPRPWPAAHAWAVFVSATLYMNMNGGGIDLVARSANTVFKTALFAYHAFVRTVEGCERWRRRGELCALAQCLRLYCASHPLSPRGWRALLGIALFCIWHAVFNAFTDNFWTPKDASSGFDLAVWAAYSGGLQLYALTLSGITGQLAGDLRQDCLRALRAAGAWVPDHKKHVAGLPNANDQARLAWSARRSSAAPAVRKGVGGMLSGGRDTLGDTRRANSPPDEFRWRRLRMRHMALLDMGCMASAISCWQVLVMIIFSVTYSTTCVSTTAGSFADLQNGPVDLYSLMYRLLPLQAGLGRLLLFVIACYTFQRAAQEHTKLSQALQGFLADTPDVPVAVIREVDKFIVQIALLDGNFDVLGMFRLDVRAMKAVLATTATYLFVLIQFRISLY